MAKKILVTGGAGFIGSHIVDALVARGDEVVVLDDLSTGKRENLANVADKITFIEGDIRDFETVMRAVQGADAIIHQAAIASVQKTIEDPLTGNAVNLTGTLNVFEAARKAGIRRVVYASSCAVYGDDPELPKRETSEVCPKSPYALHKLVGEGYARLYAELFGLETVGLRYFNVFGPRQDPSSPYSGVISIFLQKIKQNEGLTIFGDGKTTRDFIYVSDIVAANLAALDRQTHENGIFNIGTGQETSLSSVVLAFENIFHRQISVEHKPERVGDIKRSVADISRARENLGFSPKVSFEEGLRELARG